MYFQNVRLKFEVNEHNEKKGTGGVRGIVWTFLCMPRVAGVIFEFLKGWENPSFDR